MTVFNINQFDSAKNKMKIFLHFSAMMKMVLVLGLILDELHASGFISRKILMQ